MSPLQSWRNCQTLHESKYCFQNFWLMVGVFQGQMVMNVRYSSVSIKLLICNEPVSTSIGLACSDWFSQGCLIASAVERRFAWSIVSKLLTKPLALLESSSHWAWATAKIVEKIWKAIKIKKGIICTTKDFVRLAICGVLEHGFIWRCFECACMIWCQWSGFYNWLAKVANPPKLETKDFINISKKLSESFRRVLVANDDLPQQNVPLDLCFKVLGQQGMHCNLILERQVAGKHSKNHDTKAPSITFEGIPQAQVESLVRGTHLLTALLASLVVQQLQWWWCSWMGCSYDFSFIHRLVWQC